MNPGPPSGFAVECATAVVHEDWGAVADAIGDRLGVEPWEVPGEVHEAVAAQAGLAGLLVQIISRTTGDSPSRIMQEVGALVAASATMREETRR